MTHPLATHAPLSTPPPPSHANRWAPLGIATLLLLLGAFHLLDTVGLPQSLLWGVGALLGITLTHASFGFTHAWRVFIADRQAAGIRAQMLMLAFGVLLFFPVLDAGEFAGHAVRGLTAPLGTSIVVGAFIFGIGMQLGGGCASGTLYTVGGGSVRMLVTLFFFVLGSVWATADFDWWMALPSLPPVQLLKAWGLAPALLLNLAVFAFIAWGATRLERRRHGGQLASSASRTAPGTTPSIWRGPWPLLWGGLALVLLNFATLWLSGRPWGITSAFALWGAKGLLAMGVDVASWGYWATRLDSLHAPLTQDVTSVMDIGIVLGALLAASLSGKLAWHWRIPLRSLLAAVVGGLMLGYGARLAFGCNIGAYFSGILSGSLHAWLWLPAAYAGNALGVRLRPWFGLAVERLTPNARGC
ncbi:YeeE/YedE family protein [Hydrogenophaga sp.]|uniref:YeeE/YedE family protein n=1 Tax=Hydrogenophaga sp. TaxID=1904254 RepID=UPI00272354C0|nr:YeeE/YedE family protein [Hydrogenophaga sp.]MDO9435052.1 YeeE/YedE family protein [Hydrogenophaga sp.]